MTIREILERVQGDCSETCGALSVDEALSQLRTLLHDCVPKEKEYADRYVEGFYSALQQTHKMIDERMV